MLSIVDPNGVERYLGNLLPARGIMGAWPTYGDVPMTPLFPRSNWPALIRFMTPGLDHPSLPPVHDQSTVSQCNAEACTAAGEFCRAEQGLPYVRLSAGDLYGRINGGVDRGSLLEDGMEEMLANGVGTAATCGTLWPGRIAGREERRRYRATEAWLCPTFAHAMCASIAGFALINGILWHEHDNPDGDGWLPLRGTGRAGGHAIMGYKPVMRDGKFGIAHLQSWGDWALGGKFVIPEERFDRDIGGWWAVRQMVTESGDLPALVA